MSTSETSITRRSNQSEEAYAIQKIGDLHNIQASYRFNGKNYLKWAQFVRTYLKGKRKPSHILGTGPAKNDAAFELVLVISISILTLFSRMFFMFLRFWPILCLSKSSHMTLTVLLLFFPNHCVFQEQGTGKKIGLAKERGSLYYLEPSQGSHSNLSHCLA